jgi:hypothetical protein
LSWQITPIANTKAISYPYPGAATRAFDAMMTTHNIEIAAIVAARRGRYGLMQDGAAGVPATPSSTFQRVLPIAAPSA